MPQRYLPACVGELILKSQWQDRLWSVCSVARCVYRSTGRTSKGALLLTPGLPTCATGTWSVTCDRQQAKPRGWRKTHGNSKASGPQEFAAQYTAKNLMTMERLLLETCWYVASATLIRLDLTHQLTAKNACRPMRHLKVLRRASQVQCNLRDGVHELQVPRLLTRERKRN